MYFLLPAATVTMLGFMFWKVVFRLRRDRLTTTREQIRGRLPFRARNRLRLLLKRSFPVPEAPPQWEGQLVSRLSEEASETIPTR